MKLLKKLIGLIRHAPLLIRTALGRAPERVQHRVPYVCQFANPAWVEMVINSDQPIAKDMLWPESGAKTIKDYERWVLHTAGMACTAMALQFFKKTTFQTIPLAKDASNAGVYEKEPTGEISRMHFRPYVSWIKKFGLRGTIYTELSYKSLCFLLSRNRLLIATVNPNICDYDLVPKTQEGGHLVLVTGYNKKNKTITFHNPSGFENNNTQVNHTVRSIDFYIYFTGRAVAIRGV